MKNHNAFAWEIWTTINFNGKFKGNLCFQPMIKKYMVLESYISEIWYFPVNEKNIIFLVHYILFTYAFPKLSFNISLSAAISVHANMNVCNLISTKIWNLKLSNLKPTKHPTRETFEIWGNSLCHFLSFCPNPISGNSLFIGRLIDECR